MFYISFFLRQPQPGPAVGARSRASNVKFPTKTEKSKSWGAAFSGPYPPKQRIILNGGKPVSPHNSGISILVGVFSHQIE